MTAPEPKPADPTPRGGPRRETWLVAVWPGMGSVAVAAGSWLSSELGARHQLDLPAEEFFDVEKVEVHKGIARVGWRPSSTFHLWRNPGKGPDLLIFIGEAQPSSRGLEFCHRILEVAGRFGVTRVFTFAAMATPMHPGATPRVFAVANHEALLDVLRPHPVEFLEEGQINGLNGVLLAAAAELDIEGVCLLGEMPFFAVSLPNPGASLAVLEVFSSLGGFSIEVGELREQSVSVDRRLTKIFENMPQVEIEIDEEDLDDDEEDLLASVDFIDELEDSVDEGEEALRRLPGPSRAKIEKLFKEAQADRTRALALKAELERLRVFDLYEDRFLDLFREGS